MNAKLKGIYVDGYKNLIDCRAELHDFNVLVGPNNSGKSNFLEVFVFIENLLFGDEKFRDSIFDYGITPRGIFSICQIDKHKNKPLTIEVTLQTENPARDICYSVSIQCAHPTFNKKVINPGFLTEKLTIKDRGKTGRPITLLERDESSMYIKVGKNKKEHRIEPKQSALSSVRVLYPAGDGLSREFFHAYLALLDILTRVTVLALEPDELRKDLDKDTDIFMFYHLTSFDIKRKLSELHDNKNAMEGYKSALCQILDLEEVVYEKIPMPGGKKAKLKKYFSFLGLKTYGKGVAPIEEFSDGTFMVAAMLAVLFSPARNNTLLCIEEPENCLHPNALRNLIALLKQKSNQNQILITTHSPYVINHASAEDIIIARVHKDGGTRLERITNKKEMDRKLRDGYVSFGDFLESNFMIDEGVSI